MPTREPASQTLRPRFNLAWTGIPNKQNRHALSKREVTHEINEWLDEIPPGGDVQVSRMLEHGEVHHKRPCSKTPTYILSAIAEVASWGTFYETRDGRETCMGCGVTIAPDGRQPHLEDDGKPCPVGILDAVVLDHLASQGKLHVRSSRVADAPGNLASDAKADPPSDCATPLLVESAPQAHHNPRPTPFVGDQSRFSGVGRGHDHANQNPEASSE